MDSLYLVLPESPGQLLLVVFADPLVLVLVFQHLPHWGARPEKGLVLGVKYLFTGIDTGR